LTGTAAERPHPRYAWYVLSLLVIVYVLNFVDRQIISILANDIKRDLGLSDADLGFLYGTAFGVFYSLFGIPLGKLADGWNRTRLLTVGLSLWSIMTAASGLAKNGTMLAGARIGVGIGEATASPSAYSLPTLKEPVRGQADGIVTPPAERPFRNFLDELLTVIPPLTLISAARLGARALAVNVAAAIIIAAAAGLLISLTGTVAQWVAVGTGAYAVFSWASTLRHRDPPTFRLIWGTPAFLFTTLGYGFIAFQSYAVSFWAAPYAERVLHASKSEAGFWVGGPGALAGFLGVIAGGRLSDHLRKRNPAGRILVVLLVPMLSIIPLVTAFTTSSTTIFYGGIFLAGMFTSSALGATAATSQDLVLPRMRGVATATFFLATTLVGLSLGPYMAGQVSSVTGNLATGVLSVLAAVPVSATLLILAYRALPKAEATLLERARAAGEVV